MILYLYIVNLCHNCLLILCMNYSKNLGRKTISLEVEPYVKEWLHHKFGSPVNLPKGTPERKLIELHIRPGDDVELVGVESNRIVEILVPYSRDLDARLHGKISQRFKKAVSDSLSNIFMQKIWEDYTRLGIELKCTQKDWLYAYLQDNGISDDHWEALNKRLYRISNRYHKDIKKI